MGIALPRMMKCCYFFGGVHSCERQAAKVHACKSPESIWNLRSKPQIFPCGRDGKINLIARGFYICTHSRPLEGGMTISNRKKIEVGVFLFLP